MKIFLNKIINWFDEWGTTLLILVLFSIALWFLYIIDTGNYPVWLKSFIVG